MLPRIQCRARSAGSDRQRAVGDRSWTFGTGYGGRSPLVSQLAFDKGRSWAISGQESTKSPTSGERDFLCQRSISFR